MLPAELSPLPVLHLKDAAAEASSELHSGKLTNLRVATPTPSAPDLQQYVVPNMKVLGYMVECSGGSVTTRCFTPVKPMVDRTLCHTAKDTL